jgi:hypothetical protein
VGGWRPAQLGEKAGGARLGVTLTCGPHWQRVREGRRGGGVLGHVGRKWRGDSGHAGRKRRWTGEVGCEQRKENKKKEERWAGPRDEVR